MKEKLKNLYDYSYSTRSAIYLALLCAVVIVLSTKGITEESVIAMNGDMPKYLMNGVYFYDLIGDLPIINFFEHAYRYFARYPALSLGHHPILLGIAEVPFYAIFGITVGSARLTIVFFMLLATISWFLLIRSVYDEIVAFLSSLLLVTTPFIVEFSRIVMSEIPTLALIILATYFFYQYCQLDDKKYAFLTAVILVLSLYSKQIAIFMLPVFFFYLLIQKGPKRLIRKDLIISYIIVIVLSLPLILITLKFSQGNVAWVTQKTVGSRLSLSNLSFYLKMLWENHLTLPVLIGSLISIFVSLYRRDKRSMIFLFWIIGCYLLLTSLGIQKNARYAMYWIPPFCLFAAMSVNIFRYRSWRVLVSTILLVIAGYQFAVAFRMEPAYASGYEEAAKYVVENRKGESVLFSGVKDTGYFIFFVRKHDPDRELIVLRSDKVLATSRMSSIIKERITKREEIYEILKDYGVGYVVIEDTETGSRSLEWLREEVKSAKFILRKEIPLRSSARKVNNVPLAVYEYKEYTPPKEGVLFHINIPLMGDSIEVPFKDLFQKN